LKWFEGVEGTEREVGWGRWPGAGEGATDPFQLCAVYS